MRRLEERSDFRHLKGNAWHGYQMSEVAALFQTTSYPQGFPPWVLAFDRNLGIAPHLILISNLSSVIEYQKS
jgi:hypothetical protein